MNFRFKLKSLLRKGQLDADMSEEMRAHLELQTHENIARGMSPDEARYAAQRAFGGVEQIKERCREERGWMWLEQFFCDVRYGARSLSKSPGFTIAVVLTLALGIGANTAIFSVIHGVLLKPLGYREPDQIVTILHEGRHPVAPADFFDWRAQATSFEIMAAAQAWSGILAGERPEAVPGIAFGPGMFEVLGVPALLGRTFQPRDFELGSERAVVLGHGLWQRRFGGDPAIVGTTITIAGSPHLVVGVMPERFQFMPFWVTGAEMAAALDLRSRATERSSNSLRVLARLKNDVAREQAQAEMDAICRQLAAAYPETNTGRTVRVEPLMEKVVGDVRDSLRMLAGAVGFVLLIACANVANLLLARSAARRKEMAVRTALGASRGRTIRQLLAESAVLALCGGAAGLALGYAGVAGIKAMLMTDAGNSAARMPRLAEIAVDASTLGFTVAVALATALAFGLLPAWQAARAAQRDALQEGGGRGTTGGRGGRRLRHTLVVTQIALALITLTGAGLMLRSFLQVSAIDPGFKPDGVLSAIVSLQGQPDMVGEKRDEFYRELLERIRALPGVTAANAVNHLPLAGDLWGVGVSIEGRPQARPGEGIAAAYRVCLPGYFATMGIALRQGREFSASDTASAPGVAIVNEDFARKHWPGQSPVGRRLTLDDSAGGANWLTVVGVVENVKQRNWMVSANEEMYLPFAQTPFRSDAAPHYAAMTLVVRTALEPLALASAVRNAVWSLNRSAPVTQVASLGQVIAGATWQPRFNLLLVGLFATVALLLAAIGLYGVIAYGAAQRTREIGVRLALGADGRDVSRLVLREGIGLAMIGLAVGLAGALALARMMSGLLFEVQPSDPATYALVCLLLLGVALLASWLPARRAARVDPMVALRCE